MGKLYIHVSGFIAEVSPDMYLTFFLGTIPSWRLCIVYTLEGCPSTIETDTGNKVVKVWCRQTKILVSMATCCLL